jgi:exodeoxyribonuclease-3
VRIATWNVNSLKARLQRVEEWLEQVQPDVLCMQETKLADDAFPALAWFDQPRCALQRDNAQGVSSARGQREPGGSRRRRRRLLRRDEPDADARLIWATCGGVRVASVYVPNGRSLDDDHYQYKLRWLERLRGVLDEQYEPSSLLAILGDFNIAPEDRDVYDPAAFVGETHTSQPERDALARLEEWGLVDVFRQRYEAGGLFSWWDYRAGNFHKGKGMRIDLTLATECGRPRRRAT